LGDNGNPEGYNQGHLKSSILTAYAQPKGAYCSFQVEDLNHPCILHKISYAFQILAGFEQAELVKIEDFKSILLLGFT